MSRVDCSVVTAAGTVAQHGVFARQTKKLSFLDIFGSELNCGRRHRNAHPIDHLIKFTQFFSSKCALYAVPDRREVNFLKEVVRRKRLKNKIHHQISRGFPFKSREFFE